MEKYIDQIVSYLTGVFQSSATQLFILFGPLLILALFLNLSATLNARLSIRFWGRDLFLYGFVWLGCSIHELSHAFFALIFGHKINEISLFKPNSSGDSLGHVSHSFNKKSSYQKIGNFFIGIGPLLAGGIVLFGAMFLLYEIDVTTIFKFQISTSVITNHVVFEQFLNACWTSLLSFKDLLLPTKGAPWWKIALLIYLLYATCSSMTLSKSDVKGALSGLMWLTIYVLIFNLLTLWIGDFAAKYLSQGMLFITAFYFLLIVSFVFNLIFIAIFFVLNLLKNLFVR
jgi:hypothetical protein